MKPNMKPEVYLCVKKITIKIWTKKLSSFYDLRNTSSQGPHSNVW